MSVCPQPSRKYTAFRGRTLARGLQLSKAMYNRFMFLLALGTALTAFAPRTFAQASDLIVSINDEGFLSDTQDSRFFNAANCADPAGTSFELRIDTTVGTAVGQVYLWVGGQNSECNLEKNRTDITSNRCSPVAGEAAQTLDANNLIKGLTLADLTDNEVVNCANTALEGQPYELYGFRNEPPGAQDILPESFGVAQFKVDVTAPAPPAVNTDPGLGESFTLNWPQPTDDLQLYRFYRNDIEDDPDTAVLIEGVTADQNATSQVFTATGLELEQDESTYLYVTAVDKASAVPGNGNESEKSAGKMVTAAATAGFCDASGACTGCSVSPLSMIGGTSGAAAWMLGLLFAAIGVWRLRR